MADLEVVFLVLAWVGIFGLLVVVPWIVVQVMVAVLEVDVEATIDRWIPTVREPASEWPDDSPTEATIDERPADAVRSDRVAQDRADPRTPARLKRER